MYSKKLYRMLPRAGLTLGAGGPITEGPLIFRRGTQQRNKQDLFWKMSQKTNDQILGKTPRGAETLLLTYKQSF